jgi:hypothetical protein
MVAVGDALERFVAMAEAMTALIQEAYIQDPCMRSADDFVKAMD